MVELNHEGLISELEQKFTLLETGISHAIAKIDSLKRDNLELSESLRIAQSRISELESSLDESRSQAAEADKWQQQVQDLTQVRTLVTGKIERLMEKIDQLTMTEE